MSAARPIVDTSQKGVGQQPNGGQTEVEWQSNRSQAGVKRATFAFVPLPDLGCWSSKRPYFEAASPNVERRMSNRRYLV
ncbi:hypothetical protein Acr_03g0011360 [Actinidia rufa]|uniref:Uncharacterized protein n=1 Tax=Actinidia rufa TaxID=165716 RepID=A0A7J0EDD7_9ERIC|nr:hypothetical protein Acr_03g0011360 [Actinidia rufa]